MRLPPANFSAVVKSLNSEDVGSIEVQVKRVRTALLIAVEGQAGKQWGQQIAWECSQLIVRGIQMEQQVASRQVGQRR